MSEWIMRSSYKNEGRNTKEMDWDWKSVGGGDEADGKL